MLSQFSVKNFKSIKNEVTLNMEAASIREHKDQIILDNNEYFLPISAIYGPNGGGKTNILEALAALKNKVMGPVYSVTNNMSYQATPIIPYAFSDENKTQPTEFEIFYRTKLGEYRYYLSVLDNKVVEENLAIKKFTTNRISNLFDRQKQNIELGDELAKVKVSDDLSNEICFFSYLMLTYKNKILDASNFFYDGFKVLNYGSGLLENYYLINNLNEKQIILNMLKEMDIDVVNYRIEHLEDQRIKIYTSHRVNNKNFELELPLESSGTKKIFNVLPYIIKSLTSGMTLVIDELDAKIHPVLLKYIISLFTDMNINKKQAQLIFTSHDITTMTSELFRRDEIWFVAKGKEEDSILYSLVEFKDANGESIRNDAKYSKQYLEGRYGADPYLKKIINWENIDEK